MDLLRILGETTQDKSTVPETLRAVGKNAWYGKRGKVHTLLLPTAIPKVQLDHANIKVLGAGQVLENRDIEVHSWHRNFYNMMVSIFGATNLTSTSWGDGFLSAKATSGTVYGNNSSWYGMRSDGEAASGGYSAACADGAKGVVIGTNAGSSPEDFDDHALDTQIAHGVAATQMYYATDPAPAVHPWSDPDWGHIRTRYFDNFNANGNAISVSELAIYCHCFTWNTWGPFMWERTVLESPVSVPFRAQLGASFTFNLEYDDTDNLLRNLYNMVASECMSLNIDTPSPFGDGRLNLLNTSNEVITQSNIWYWSTGATQEFFNLHQTNRGYSSTAGYSGRAITVGSGNTAVTFDDYNLATPIAHGSAGGELLFGLTEAPVQNWSDPTFTVSHARTFTNDSGGTVTVREIGVIGSVYLQLVLVFRKVISDIAIADGESLRVVFQPQIAFPS